MAYIPFPTAIRIVLTFMLAGKAVTVTLGVETPSAPTLTNLTDAAQTPVNWFSGAGNTLFSTGLTLPHSQAYDLSSVSAPVFTYTPSPTPAGGSAAQSVNNQTALVTSPRTTSRGRSYRGREYWPGVPENGLQDSRNWNTTTLAAFGTAFATLVSQLAAKNLVLSVLSKENNKAPRPIGVATPTNGFVIDQLTGTVRRRVR